MASSRSPQTDLLTCYESLHLASLRMLAAARASDWDGVAGAESVCERLFETIIAIGDPVKILDDRGRRRRRQILSSVISADAKISDLVNPWLTGLERYLPRPGHSSHSASP